MGIYNVIRLLMLNNDLGMGNHDKEVVVFHNGRYESIVAATQDLDGKIIVFTGERENGPSSVSEI